MLFFRSEDQIRAWCSTGGHSVRPTIEMATLWGLAKSWYHTRLRPDARWPRSDEMRRIFAGLGLTDSFWDPRADSFDA